MYLKSPYKSFNYRVGNIGFGEYSGGIKRSPNTITRNINYATSFKEVIIVLFLAQTCEYFTETWITNVIYNN